MPSSPSSRGSATHKVSKQSVFGRNVGSQLVWFGLRSPLANSDFQIAPLAVSAINRSPDRLKASPLATRFCAQPGSEVRWLPTTTVLSLGGIRKSSSQSRLLVVQSAGEVAENELALHTRPWFV